MVGRRFNADAASKIRKILLAWKKYRGSIRSSMWLYSALRSEGSSSSLRCRSEKSSQFLNPSSRDFVTILTHRKTPFAFVTIFLTRERAPFGFVVSNLSIFGSRCNFSRTYSCISEDVKSCNLRLESSPKASSKTSHGRLETQILTKGDLAVSLIRHTSSSGSALDSSRPSMKKQSLKSSRGKFY